MEKLFVLVMAAAMFYVVHGAELCGDKLNGTKFKQSTRLGTIMSGEWFTNPGDSAIPKHDQQTLVVFSYREPFKLKALTVVYESDVNKKTMLTLRDGNETVAEYGKAEGKGISETNYINDFGDVRQQSAITKFVVAIRCKGATKKDTCKFKIQCLIGCK